MIFKKFKFNMAEFVEAVKNSPDVCNDCKHRDAYDCEIDYSGNCPRGMYPCRKHSKRVSKRDLACQDYEVYIEPE